MESGSGPKEPQPFGPGSPGYGPGAEPEKKPDDGPQSPAEPGPQSPAPGAEPPPPSSPPTPSAPQAPAGPQSPTPGGEPYSPPPYQPPQPESPVPASGTASTYGGPVPPGGWDQPMSPAGASAPVPMGELASWGSRLGAWFIDALVLLVPAAILFFLIVGSAIGISGDDDDVAWGAAIGAIILWVILFAVISLLYAPLLMRREGANNGQTWGKQALGIRVVNNDGQPMTFGKAALREIVLKNLAVGIASSIIPILPWFLNYFWPLWDDENRALHDMAVSTHVVRA